MFEEFEEFEKMTDVETEGELSEGRFHIVETDDPENPHVVGGVPELWAERLDSVQGDNFFGMRGDCGLVSVCNVERMAGMDHVTETSTCLRALLTGNCQFNIFDMEGSGGTTMEQQERLLDRHGIESTAYDSSEANAERIAEWVEAGHGVILEHSTYLSGDAGDTLDLHYDLETMETMFPDTQSMIDAARSLQDGESISISIPFIPGLFGMDVSCSISNEGLDIHLTGDGLDGFTTVDEYGQVHADHAATVTGTVRDIDGNLLGIRVCDSGWGDGDRFISVEQLEECYTNVFGSGVVVTDAPIHMNGEALNA
ncbi:MAG: hypothetical protein LUI87_10805 [Lachnospiraceae bacterium]|nr:hypothetical protein [Lachnospiraceae bacterium]